jgi:hypothetical protein
LFLASAAPFDCFVIQSKHTLPAKVKATRRNADSSERRPPP